MNRDYFLEQMGRLRSEWPNSYGDERVKILWDHFKMETDAKFLRMVTRALGTLRSAPLVPELLKIQEDITTEDKNRERDRYLGDASFQGVMAHAAKNNKRADPEFVKQCMKLLKDKLDGRITHEQFLQGCDLLDIAASVGGMP